MKTLCQSVADAAKERCPTLVSKADFIQKTFERAFTLFDACRQLYDSAKILSEGEICDLGTYYGTTCTIICFSVSIEVRIDKFLEFYRDAFPEATVTPKLHMMEDHIVPFLRQWKRGLGLLGEQGAESIHARFNNIRANYSNMHNRVERLECIMKEHFSQVCPENIIRLPPVKKRKAVERE